jgi:bacteriorhodopsin
MVAVTTQLVLQATIGERPEAVWLGLGTLLMLVGTIYFVARGWGVTDPEKQEYYVITTMITGIATAAYLSMFFGFGLTEVEVTGRGVIDIYWARYADWLFTTPLLLLDLALLASASRVEISALIILDAFMIVTGLVGALTTQNAFRFVWWAISTLAMILVLYFLYSILTARANNLDEDRRSTFITLRNLTLVLWTLYPILWLVGTEGTGVVNLFVETLGFMILDVLAKVGFGLVLLRSRTITGESEQPVGTTTTDGGTR